MRVPRRTGERTTGVVGDLREGWTYFRTTTWLWVVVLAFGALNAIMGGVWHTLGPVVAKDTIGITGWGYVLSAQAVGLLVTSVVLLRVRIRYPLRAGMLGCMAVRRPVAHAGARARCSLPLVAGMFLAGAGIEVFGLGWSLAMQENVPEEMLSRAYSYDALGSLVAMPAGQLVAGPLGEWFGLGPVLAASGVLYAGLCLAHARVPLGAQPRAEPGRPSHGAAAPD